MLIINSCIHLSDPVKVVSYIHEVERADTLPPVYLIG